MPVFDTALAFARDNFDYKENSIIRRQTVGKTCGRRSLTLRIVHCSVGHRQHDIVLAASGALPWQTCRNQRRS